MAPSQTEIGRSRPNSFLAISAARRERRFRSGGIVATTHLARLTKIGESDDQILGKKA
jgi:hypothetical protein